MRKKKTFSRSVLTSETTGEDDTRTTQLAVHGQRGPRTSQVQGRGRSRGGVRASHAHTPQRSGRYSAGHGQVKPQPQSTRMWCERKATEPKAVTPSNPWRRRQMDKDAKAKLAHSPALLLNPPNNRRAWRRKSHGKKIRSRSVCARTDGIFRSLASHIAPILSFHGSAGRQSVSQSAGAPRPAGEGSIDRSGSGSGEKRVRCFLRAASNGKAEARGSTATAS